MDRNADRPQFANDLDKSKKRHAIVCISPRKRLPWTCTLSETGCMILSLDVSCQGTSESPSHNLKGPAIRPEDFRCATDFLTTLWLY